ncbi:MAG: fructosamine kinase family protein [Gammaproteobacteria bacterium]|nr:fructosamine kinase family protein [Gammaproteobacteria bacterium]
MDNYFWNHISNLISEITKCNFQILNKYSVHGGCINQAYLLVGNDINYFVKVNHQSSIGNFNCEMACLNALKRTNSIKVPEVITADTYDNNSYLILEALQLSERGVIADFAVALANLHKSSGSEFGFDEDNYIGATKQINKKNSDWVSFFYQNRISYQLDLLQEKYNIHEMRNNEKLYATKINELFEDYSPLPSLLHGDLWQGNYSFDQQGTPVIFDPACYYGDHEVDLAMLELFGNPGDSFFKAYHKHFPIDKGYQRRKGFYNFYHILNHANLFGSSYIGQAESMMDTILNY